MVSGIWVLSGNPVNYVTEIDLLNGNLRSGRYLYIRIINLLPESRVKEL